MAKQTKSSSSTPETKYGGRTRRQFLADIRKLAGSAASIDEAAGVLGIEPGDLRQLFATDPTVARAWNSTRLKLTIAVKKAVVAKAKEGSLQAISAVERSLREAIAKPGVDIHNITGAMLARLVGVSGKSIWDWQKRGLRQNGQGAYDLAVFLPWYRDHLLSQVCVGKNSDTDPLRTQKAREKAIQVAELEGRLWPREQVMAGLAARARVLAETLSATKASELGQRLGGQPEPEIARIIEAFFIEAKRAACQLDEELRLPPAARKLWTDLMTMLSKTEGDE